MVKQKMVRVNTDISGIRELKWMGMVSLIQNLTQPPVGESKAQLVPRQLPDPVLMGGCPPHCPSIVRPLSCPCLPPLPGGATVSAGSCLAPQGPRGPSQAVCSMVAPGLALQPRVSPLLAFSQVLSLTETEQHSCS